MADTTRMRLVFDRRLMRTLRSLTPAAQRRVQRPAVGKMASIVSKAAKQRVPTDTGTLKKSIGVRRPLPFKGETVIGVVGPRAGFRVDTPRGIRWATKYAHLVEYGADPHTIEARAGGALDIDGGGPVPAVLHPGSPPQPFMRPALDSNREKLQRVAGEKLREGLEKHFERERARGPA